MAEQFAIRRLHRDEVRAVKQLTDQEEWNLGLSYLERGYDMDPSGWNVAVDQNGEVIGCCVGVVLNDALSMMSCFIVHPIHRGKGIGGQLWRATIQRLEGKNIILTAANVNLYIKEGFNPTHEIHIMSYIKKQPMTLHTSSDIDSSFHIMDVKDVSISDVDKYDKIICSFERSNFFQGQIISGCSFGAVAIDNNTDDVIGYGTLKKGSEVWKAFPIYAETDDVARKLLKALLQFIPEGDTVQVSPYVENKSAIDLFNEVGFIQVLALTSMYNRFEVVVPIEKIYSLSSHEFSFC